MPRHHTVLLGLLALSACGAPSVAPDAGWWAQGPLAECAKLGGAAPESIAASVDRLNQLPKPTSVACFVASLPRPLRLVATRSTQSAQPADSVRSPRIFIISPKVIWSVVPDGVSAHLLEFGEFYTDKDTIKAELAFPLTEAIAASKPYEGLELPGGLSSCGLCHRNEQQHPTIPLARVSVAFRTQNGLAVSLESLQNEHATCDRAAEPARCEMLAALFGFGEAKQGAFPANLDRFLP